MNRLPDTAPTSPLEIRSQPARPTPSCMDEEMAMADFQHLLDTPNSEAKTTLAAEQTQETAIEASAWLALNTINTAECVPAEPSHTVSSSAPIALSTAEPSNHSVLHPETALPATQLPIQPEIMPETESTPLPCLSNNTEMSATQTVPIALHPTPLSPLLFAKPITANPSLPVPHLQRANFEHGIATHLNWMADQSIDQAHIQITPAHLGPVEIQLHLRDKHLHATFFSPHTEVCQRLQESLPVLHQLLDEHGLHLAQADVHQQAADSHTHTAKTAELFAIKENTAEEKKALEPVQHVQTALLDTWA